MHRFSFIRWHWIVVDSSVVSLLYCVCINQFMRWKRGYFLSFSKRYLSKYPIIGLSSADIKLLPYSWVDIDACIHCGFQANKLFAIFHTSVHMFTIFHLVYIGLMLSDVAMLRLVVIFRNALLLVFGVCDDLQSTFVAPPNSHLYHVL